MISSPHATTLGGFRLRLHDAVYDLLRGLGPDMALERIRRALGTPTPLTHATLESVLLSTPDLTVAAAWRRFNQRYPVIPLDTSHFAPQVAP